MSERKLLGEKLSVEEKIYLAQLAAQPGWPILVRLMAEACRDATEAVIKVDPIKTERYNEIIGQLQMTARAINKFSADVLDSVKVRQSEALRSVEEREKVEASLTKNRFHGFTVPQKPQSPTEGEQ